MMNRIATLTDPKGDMYEGKIDSEWVVGHHLMLNDITVRFWFYCFLVKL